MKWIISANHNKYDHESAFKKWKFIDWKQGNYSYQVGDIVYIYATAPYKTIRYKTIVIEIDKIAEDIVDDSMFWVDKEKYNEAIDGKYMRLDLIKRYDSRDLDLDKLMENGLNGAPQGPQRLSKELAIYIENLDMELNLYPETIEENEIIYEGIKEKVTINKYERNPKARKECINHYGYNCKVCGMNFEEEYGVVGKNFIHVHHIIPLSEIGERYEVNPIEDLIPVCPNCHAMIHRGMDYTIK